MHGHSQLDTGGLEHSLLVPHVMHLPNKQDSSCFLIPKRERHFKIKAKFSLNLMVAFKGF